MDKLPKDHFATGDSKADEYNFLEEVKSFREDAYDFMTEGFMKIC